MAGSTQNWLPGALEELAEMAKLDEDWASDGSPPSPDAIKTARLLIDGLAVSGEAPRRIIPTADSGVLFLFGFGEHMAEVEVEADGQMLLVTIESPGAEEEHEELDPQAAAAGVVAFIHR